MQDALHDHPGSVAGRFLPGHSRLFVQEQLGVPIEDDVRHEEGTAGSNDGGAPLTAAPPKPWFAYLVRAENGALYCGISDDPLRRFEQHRSGKGARFFHSSPAQALVYVEACADKGGALRRERAIKQLSKKAKEALVLAAGVMALADNPVSG